MSLEKLFRLSGFFLLVSGCLMLIQLILNPVDTGVTTIKEPLIVLANLLAFFSVICTLFGLPAVFLRQADRAGLLGLLGMLAIFFGIALSDATHTVISFAVLPVLATSTATASHLGSLDTAIQQGLQGTLGTVGGLMTLLGLLLLGIATLRAGIFPRWVGIVFIVVLPIIPLSFFVPILSNVGLELPYFALATAGVVLLVGRGLRQARPMTQVREAL